MADRTESSIVVAATPAAVIDAIADFEAYPAWVSDVTEARILSEEGDGWADQVQFTLDAGVLRDTYVLEYDWDIVESGAGVVSWNLVKSNILKVMSGSYTLKPEGRRKTHVTYRLAVAVKIPIIGALKRRAEQVIVDTALANLKKRVES